MTVIISVNDTDVTLPDNIDVAVTGTGDTVHTSDSSISFIGNPGNTLTVDGANDVILLETEGETLTLTQTDTGAVIAAADGSVVNASGDMLLLDMSCADFNSTVTF